MKPEGKLNKNMIKRISYHDLMINLSQNYDIRPIKVKIYNIGTKVKL